MGIMGFGKKRPDTIDLTRLDESNLPSNRPTNRTIINSSPSSSTPKYSDSDVVDLRPNVSPTNNSNVSSQQSNFDFLESSSSNSGFSSYSNPIKEVSELSELKIQMRKITGTIEDSSNEVYRLMQRIELLERKMERFENRGS